MTAGWFGLWIWIVSALFLNRVNILGAVVAALIIAGPAVVSLPDLWLVIGREIIEISYESVVIRRDLFHIGFNREYAAHRVKNMRITVPMSSSIRATTTGPSRLAFDYDGEIVRFAVVEEEEAALLLEAIACKFPALIDDPHITHFANLGWFDQSSFNPNNSRALCVVISPISFNDFSCSSEIMAAVCGKYDGSLVLPRNGTGAK
jgi:hypothetical protein